MALDFLFSGKSMAKLGVKPDYIQLDASLKESHNYTAKATAFPIEDGSEISDHVLINPITVTIDGFITNSPIKYLEGFRSDIDYKTGSGERHKTVFKLLNELFTNKTKIEIITGLESYSDMIIESLTVPRDAATGQALRFSMSLKQIKTTSFKESDLPDEKLGDKNNSKNQVSTKKDVGKQQTTIPTDSEKVQGSFYYNKAKAAGVIK